MNDIGGMNVLETAKGLINKRLEMGVREGLLGSDLGGEHLAIGRYWDQPNLR